MPFTEEELRAVLEDNSAEVPPVSDLTGNAERQGRKVRRRRYTAGAVAAACAVAVGVLTLPGLVDDGGRVRPAAASVSPSPGPQHVDVSVLTGPAERRLVIEHRKALAWLATKKRPASPMPVNLGGLSSPSAMAAFSDVVVTGTVEGFTTGQTWPAPPAPSSGAGPAKTSKSVVMQVRVDKTLKGPAPGPRAYIMVGSGPDADAARFQAAIPAGARLVAFLQQVASPLGDGGPGTGHPAGTTLMDQQQGLVFEDADATGTKLVGGPYLQAKYLGKPWAEATTIDRLATLLQTVKDDCTAMGDRLAMLKAKLRDQQAADRTAARIVIDQRARCGKLTIVRSRPPAPAATPSP
jgi:hypothetical protein